MNRNQILTLLLLIVSMLSLAACDLTDDQSTTQSPDVTDTTATVDTTADTANAVCVVDSASIVEMIPADYLNDTALALITVWDSDSVIVVDTTIRANLYPTFNWLQVTLNTPCSNVIGAIDSLEQNGEYIGTYTNKAGETFSMEVNLFYKRECMVYNECESLFELYYPQDSTDSTEQ